MLIPTTGTHAHTLACERLLGKDARQRLLHGSLRLSEANSYAKRKPAQPGVPKRRRDREASDRTPDLLVAASRGCRSRWVQQVGIGMWRWDIAGIVRVRTPHANGKLTGRTGKRPPNRLERPGKASGN